MNDKGNAVIGTRYGRLNGMFGANEMSICKQNLILQEELNYQCSQSWHLSSPYRVVRDFLNVRVNQNSQATHPSV